MKLLHVYTFQMFVIFHLERVHAEPHVGFLILVEDYVNDFVTVNVGTATTTSKLKELVKVDAVI